MVGLVLDKTSLYAEKGGQTFHKAEITSKDGKTVMDVVDCHTYASIVVHCGKITSITPNR